jgi:hypothetical protein
MMMKLDPSSKAAIPYQSSQFQGHSKTKSQKLSLDEMAKMMKDISATSYYSQRINSSMSSKPAGGLLNFDLQTKRPDFVEYAAKTKPHDNRFLNLNLDSLSLSKNQRPMLIDFSK